MDRTDRNIQYQKEIDKNRQEQRLKERNKQDFISDIENYCIISIA